MLGFIKNLLPSKKEKDVKGLEPLVQQINEEYAALHGLTDDELRGKTAEFKARIQDSLWN